MLQRSKTSELPSILRCCGYRSRRRGRWVGYCLELQLRTEGRDWDEVLERLMMAASLQLARLQQEPELERFRLAPFRMRLVYAGIALMHFVRPQDRWCLADLSPRLLVDLPSPR